MERPDGLAETSDALASAVRPATLADLVGLHLAFQDFMREHALAYPTYDREATAAFVATLADRLVREDPALIAWVAPSQDAPNLDGFLLADISERAVGSPRRFVTVHWLYVAPGARDRGLGRALSAAGLQESLAKGVAVAELSSKPDDPQWALRGWTPIAVVYALPLDQIAATFRPRATEQ